MSGLCRRFMKQIAVLFSNGLCGITSVMNMMQQKQGGDAPAAVSDNPQTKAEVQALLDSLDMKLAKGEISEAIYNKLVEKWQQRLESM